MKSPLQGRALGRQIWALGYKTFLVAVWRRPIPFLIISYIIPIGLLGLLIAIPYFVTDDNSLGVSNVAALPNLADTITDQQLIFVRPANLGPDVDDVIKSVSAPLPQAKVRVLDDDQDLATVCLANVRGVSACHAAISFYDSPLTTGQGVNHVWNYSMRGDPARQGQSFHIQAHDSDQERRYLPLQLAVESAMASSSANSSTNGSAIQPPSVVAYTTQTPLDAAQNNREERVALATDLYGFALFAAFISMINHLATTICRERDSGMAALIDAMGGGAASRVMGYMLVFNVAYLPTWIAFGVLYGRLLFLTTNTGVFILWQILTGLAVVSSTVFAAAFFRKARASAIYIVGAFFLLAVIPMICLSYLGVGGVVALAALFPSSNHFFFLSIASTFELNTESFAFNVYVVNQYDWSENFPVNGTLLFVFLALQTVVYSGLAVLVERLVHGINFRGREFAKAPEPTSSVVLQATDLRKLFAPTWTERVFCCGRKKPVRAVDSVSFEGHRGQILCLVGPNGSGKTTTLQMIGGFVAPTDGTVALDALPSQLGVCPQQNTLWDELTVTEHVRLWSEIKAAAAPGGQGADAPAQLIAACDLVAKAGSQAGTLSGGQKRKLQLACMFAGGSSVCLIDECTSGLDPLSRRAIWDILAEQRARRSIVFTTHFLDEVDVLADHVVLLAAGRVRCQGTTAQLKQLFGGGYRVLAPRGVDAAEELRRELGVPASTHQDQVVYTVPDSRAAAELAARLDAAGVEGVSVAGPQFEDVFLNVADDPELREAAAEGNEAVAAASAATAAADLTPGVTTSFGAQVGALLWKRFRVLKRFWWPYLYVLVLPLVTTPFLGSGMLNNYKRPGCGYIQPVIDATFPFELEFYEYSDPSFDNAAPFTSGQILLGGPPAANDSLLDFVGRNYSLVRDLNASLYGDWVRSEPNLASFVGWLTTNASEVSDALYLDPGAGTDVVGYQAGSYVQNALEVMNLYTQLRGGVQIVAGYGEFAQLTKATDLSGISYAVFFTLIQALWPFAFVLYPAVEAQAKVRALEFANGVRRGPLWAAYILFDAIFVFVIALATTAIVAMPPTGPAWVGSASIMFPVLFFYGLAATLVFHIVARLCKGPLSAFFWCLTVATVSFAVTCIGFAVASTYSDPGEISRIADAVTFSLNLLFPIGNVFRACLVGLNARAMACDGDGFYAPSSIYAYGGPILYLIVQVAAFLALLVWLERPRHAGRLGRLLPAKDVEKSVGAAASAEVADECRRVEAAEHDLLRVLHLTKSFGPNTAVDDVTLGLREGEVMALIGPNGAGKSTLVNMIRAEMAPDSGEVFLRDENAFSASAQKYLGVCPQYDALDLLNTREQLMFYAKIKGIKDAKRNVDTIMAKLGLTLHASQPASKLSGGNKRKLSLAIALMGTPPVLVLDEPTSAMDAVAKRAFWKIIKEISPNRSLLLTTHSMEEADTLASRAAIISRRLLAVGTTRALREQYSDVNYVQLVLRSAPYSAPGETEALAEWVRAAVPGAALEPKCLGGQVRFTIPGAGARTGTRTGTGRRRSPVVELIRLLEREKGAVGIGYYSIGGATLERVFLSVVRENNVAEEDEGQKKRMFGRWDLGV